MQYNVMYACMHGCMDVLIYGCMDAVWMYGWMEVWRYGCLYLGSISLYIASARLPAPQRGSVARCCGHCCPTTACSRSGLRIWRNDGIRRGWKTFKMKVNGYIGIRKDWTIYQEWMRYVIYIYTVYIHLNVGLPCGRRICFERSYPNLYRQICSIVRLSFERVTHHST